MTDHTDNLVLMKCEKCNYLEKISEEELAILRRLPPLDDEDHMLCPFCLHDMYRIDSPRFIKK